MSNNFRIKNVNPLINNKEKKVQNNYPKRRYKK